MTYTKAHHDKTKARIQAVLDFGLRYIEPFEMTEHTIMTGYLPNGSIIEISNRLVFETIGYFNIFWNSDYLRIQYDPNTYEVADSTEWNGEIYLQNGHLQVAYSREQYDTEYTFDFESLLLALGDLDWSVVDRKKSILNPPIH